MSRRKLIIQLLKEGSALGTKEEERNFIIMTATILIHREIKKGKEINIKELYMEAVGELVDEQLNTPEQEIKPDEEKINEPRYN